MTSCSKISFDDFFSNLPTRSLTEICKNLGAVDLISYSMVSDKWREAVRAGGRRENSFLEAQMAENNDRFMVIFEKSTRIGPDRNACCGFVVTYEESEDCIEDVHLIEDFSEKFVHSEWLPGRRLLPFQFNFYAKSLESLEESAMKMMALICELFPPTYNSLHLSLGHRPTPYPLRLLLSFPAGTGRELIIQMGEHAISYAHLEQLLKKIQFTESIEVFPRIYGFRETEFIVPDVNKHILFSNSRFMTRRHLETMRFKTATFCDNRLTSQDFNAFLRHWKEGKTSKEIVEASFQITEFQSIKKEDVLKGLDVKPWDSELRNRIYIDREGKGLDLRTGLDMINVKGVLGTVYLVDNEFALITWPDRYPVETEENRLLKCLSDDEKTLEIVLSERWDSDEDESEDEDGPTREGWQAEVDREVRKLGNNIEENRQRLEELRIEWKDDKRPPPLSK